MLRRDEQLNRGRKSLQISEWVSRLKGASAHHINLEIANRRLLEWQDG